MDGDVDLLCVHWFVAGANVCDLHSYQQPLVQSMFIPHNVVQVVPVYPLLFMHVSIPFHDD